MSCGSSGVRTSAAARSGQICKWTRKRASATSSAIIGDVLRGQLLPKEARAIGKRAGKLATKAKDELETAKAKAATKRSKRRACSEPGIGLDEACAAINAEAADIRSAILATACELGLPAAESVARRAAAADSKLRKLRKDEIEVRQALELADAHRVEAHF